MILLDETSSNSYLEFNQTHRASRNKSTMVLINTHAFGVLNNIIEIL